MYRENNSDQSYIYVYNIIKVSRAAKVVGGHGAGKKKHYIMNFFDCILLYVCIIIIFGYLRALGGQVMVVVVAATAVSGDPVFGQQVANPRRCARSPRKQQKYN